MKQIYIIEMAFPSWRYRADREELKTIKYNLERQPDFKVDQSNININIDGILAGECCMYVCLFQFVFFFWLRISEKIGIPSRFCRSRKSLTVSPISSCGGYEVAPLVNGRCHCKTLGPVIESFPTKNSGSNPDLSYPYLSPWLHYHTDPQNSEKFKHLKLANCLS